MSFVKSLASIEVQVEKPQRMTVLGFDRQPLRNEDGSTNYVDVFSADSEAARRHQRSVANRRINSRGKVTAAALESDGVELLVALTAGWGSLSKDGKTATPDPDFSPDAARALYSDPRNAELRAQVDEFAADRGNFSKALSSSSSNTASMSSGKAES